MKKALIFGIAGQDGSYLAQFLLKKGYEVWGTSRDAELSSLENFKLLGIIGQIKVISTLPEEFGSVFKAVEQSWPDEIYYLAGQSSVSLSFEQPQETLQSFAIGILNVLEVCRLVKKDVRIYNAGSSEVFGNTYADAATELTPFCPQSPYAIAKASAHWLVDNYRKAYNLYACTGILFNHESPLRPSRFVTQKIIQAAKRISAGSTEKLILGRLDISRDWGWAPEYVEAMWSMLQLYTPEDLIISTGQTFTLEDFVNYSFLNFGLDWKEHVIQSPDFYRPTEILISRGNPLKASEKIGWAAHYGMPQVIEKMIEGV